jgi:hypothetical protein
MKEELMLLTKRDQDVFKGLEEFGFLSTSQIKKLFFKNLDKRTMLRRLRILKKNKLIKVLTHFDRGEMIWTLTTKGARSIHTEIYIKGLNKNTLAHDLLCSDVRIKFEEQDFGSNWVNSHKFRLKAHLGRSNPNRYEDTIPDWLVQFNTTKGKKWMALEIELNFKGKGRMSRLFDLYAKKESIHHLWYFVPNRSMGEKILNASIGQTNQDFESMPKTWVLYSLIDDVKSNPSDFKINFLGGEVQSSRLLLAHPNAHSVSTQEKSA